MTPRRLHVLERPAATCCASLAAPDLSEADAVATASLFRALADPHRVRIVNLLATAQDSACICDLTDPLGLSQATVSFHMKKLVDAGLLHREQRGKWAFYSLNRAVVARVRGVLHLEPEGKR